MQNGFEVLENNNNKVILWEVVEGSNNNIYAMFWDNSRKTWGYPKKLVSSLDRIRGLSGALEPNGTINTAYCWAPFIESDNEYPYGNSDLVYRTFEPEYNLTIKLELIMTVHLSNLVKHFRYGSKSKTTVSEL